MPTVIVPLFADKITLLVQARRNPKIKTMDDLRAFLGTKQDYWSRIVNGVRAVPDDMLAKICDIFQMAPKEMLDTDILEFGTRLNFTRRQISQITSTPLPGMDFESRIRDSTHIRRLYEVMGGYWESYYFSVSKTDTVVVTRDLMLVDKPDDDFFLPCFIYELGSRYSGKCFPIKEHLYFMLEKDVLLNEIIVYATNFPDRQPPRLYGIILCLSGGVDTFHSFPAAAKVGFRYLGPTWKIRQDRKLGSDAEVETLLRREVCGYVTPGDPTNPPEVEELIGAIVNQIEAGAIPRALRMTK